MNHVYFSECDPSSDCGGSVEKVCVDRKVHLTIQRDWYDQSGCEEEAYDRVSYGDLVPCDGRCLPTCALPAAAEELVVKFLASDGKERGTHELRRPRYSDAVNHERSSEDLHGDRGDTPED